MKEEQLRKKAEELLKKHINNQGFRYGQVPRLVIFGAIEAMLELVSSIEQKEVYVPVSKDEWFKTDDKSNLIPARNFSTGEPLWLKKITIPSILLEKEVDCVTSDKSMSADKCDAPFKANATIEQLKQQCYEEATRKLLSNPSGTRMDIIYEAMAIYAAEILKEAGSFTYDDLTNHAKKDFYK